MNFAYDQLDFGFTLNTNLRFGPGQALKLPDLLKERGWSRPALVVDAGLAQSPAWQAVEAKLEGVVARLVTPIMEPTYDDLDEARKTFEGTDPDVFIVAGGGSVLDLGKALSVLHTNPGPALSYRGFNLIKNPGPPVVAIPTTAGTGSEVTPNAVFIDTKEQRKFGINTDMYLPKLAILDPELTVSCPRSVTISSGMDALVHSHESFVSKRATPMTRLLATEGFKLVFNNLEKAVSEPTNLEARGRVQWGSFLAGSALFNSSAGPAGALSYPLGVLCKVPHGIAGAVFLPYVVEHNVAAGYDGYGELHQAVTGKAGDGKDFAALVRGLCDRLEVPRDLKGFGFQAEQIPAFAEQARLLGAAFEMNPIPFPPETVRELLTRMS